LGGVSPVLSDDVEDVLGFDTEDAAGFDTDGTGSFVPIGFDTGPFDVEETGNPDVEALDAEVLNVAAEDDVDEAVGTDTGIEPGSIVLLLCLPPGLTGSPLPLLAAPFVGGEAKIPGLALTPAPIDEALEKGSIVLLLCLVPVPPAPTSTPTLLVMVVVVVVVVDVVVEVIFARTGREVTLNDGIGARCLIGIGAILSSLSLSGSNSKSDTGDCGWDEVCDCGCFAFATGDFFLNFVGDRFAVATTFPLSLSCFCFPFSPSSSCP